MLDFARYGLSRCLLVYDSTALFGRDDDQRLLRVANLADAFDVARLYSTGGNAEILAGTGLGFDYMLPRFNCTSER